MSGKIDNRIVEMSFENKGFEKGIADSSKSLMDFNKTLESSGKGSAFAGLQGVVDGVSGKFSVLGTVAVGALLQIGAQAVQAGEKIAKALILDPITAGLSEYELKINSIKTMLASGKTAAGLPVTLDQVNAQLEELNAYSDKTIYSFSDMTKNIGKFTNAGVNLEASVAAIKGIANAAALSGANAEEASRAMYNFSQALSSGYVKLIDWKSIENANMATVEFKTQLLESAVAAGTLTKTADGMYKIVGKPNALPITATKGFNDSLQEQWMTSKALTDTLAKYADETTEIGKKATEAATKVRTFTQIIDTTKEALQSGWAQSFEFIIGDFKEATELWTGLNNVIGGFIKTSSDSRNKILRDWDKFGGRIHLLNGIKSAWEGIQLILEPVGKAFAKLFSVGMLKGRFLANISADFASLMEKFNIWAKSGGAEKIGKIFEGLFSAISLGWNTLVSVFKIVTTTIKEFAPSGDSLISFAEKIATFFTNLKASAENGNFFAEKTKLVQDGITNIANKIDEVFGIFKSGEKIPTIINSIIDAFKGWPSTFGGFDSFAEKVTKFFQPLKDILEPVGKFLVDLFENIKNGLANKWETEGFSGFLDIISTIINGGILLGLKDLVGTFTDMSNSASSITGGITGIFGSLQTTLTSYQESLNAKKLLTIATAIGILAASVIGMSLVDPSKLSGAVSALTMLFVELTGTFLIMNKAMSGQQVSAIGLQLMALSMGVLLISSALAKIAEIPADRLKESLFALGVVLLELVAVSKLMGNAKSFVGAAVGLVAMGVAINIIVVAVKSLGNMDPGELKQGLIAIGEIAGGMAIFAITVSQLSKGGNLLAAGIAIGIMAVGLLELVGVVTLLGLIDPAKLAQGLIGLGLILAEILAFSILISNTINPISLLLAAASMTIMGVALLAIVGVVELLGRMKIEELTQGLQGLGVTMGIMAIAMLAMANPMVVVGAAAMLVMSAAITLLTPSLLALGAVPLANIGKALLTLIGVFVIFGVAGLVLGPMIPVLLGLALAIGLFGVALLAIGAGMALFGVGLTALSAGGTAAIGVLVLAIMEIVKLIPSILIAVGNGIINLAKVIIAGAPIIAKAIVAIIAALIVLLGTEVPKLITVLMTFISSLLAQLVIRVPEFVAAGMKIIFGFLKGISDNVQVIVETFVQMIANILNGIAVKLPELIAAGANIIIAFLQGIGEQVPRVVEAAFTMIIDFLNGLANAIRDNTPLLLTAITNLCTAFLDGFLQFFGISGGTSSKGQGIASSILQGLIDGIGSGIGSVVSAITGLGGKMIDGFKSLFKISSPSKVMEEMGTNIVDGLDEGINGGNLDNLKATENILEGMLALIESYLPMFTEGGTKIMVSLISGVQLALSQIIVTMKLVVEQMLLNMTNGFIVGSAIFTQTVQTYFVLLQGTMNQWMVALMPLVGITMMLKILEGYVLEWPIFQAKVEETFGALYSIIGASIGLVNNIGAEIVLGVAKTMDNNSPTLFGSAAALSTGTISALQGMVGPAFGIGMNAALGIASGISAGTGAAVGAAQALASAVTSALAISWQINSPSKVMEKIAIGIPEGIVNGIDNGSGMVVASTEHIADSAIISLSTVMTKISDALNADINLSPVISPVLDLNGVRAGANVLNNLLSGNQSYSLAASKVAQDRATMRDNQNGSALALAEKQGIKNEFNLYGLTVRSEADIDKIAEKLYRRQESAMRIRGIKPSYV